MSKVEIAEQLTVAEAARRARAAARVLASLPNLRRNEILLRAADVIEARRGEILAANERDCRAAESALAEERISRAMFERLRTTERGVAQMATQVREVARLADPLGRVLSATQLDDDLTLHKVTCPLGVVGIIFESRPDVVPQVAALALKSGNAVILKGGSEAASTNETLVGIWREVLATFPGVPPEAVTLFQTRAEGTAMLSLENEIDLIIPRGSREFVRYVAEHSRVPVMGHGEGICHVYIDRTADIEKALSIAFDAKVQYPAACNAVETVLVHAAVAESFLPEIINRYARAGVEVRGCPRVVAAAAAAAGGNSGRVVPADEADWATEYSDLIISLKVVDSLAEAINHIDRYGSRHTEAIVTEDDERAARFMELIDAAGVYQNASTRFADGFRYGLGAELGVSTGKLHARGPVGLDGLTTYKYKLFGNGQTVASYSSGERTFKHRRLSGE